MSRSKMEPPPPLPKFSVPNSSSKRKGHSGSGSSSPSAAAAAAFMDPDVVEIPPPINFSSPRLPKLKQKQAIPEEVIYIGDDDDLIIIGEKVGKSNKGKKVEAVHDGFSNHQAADDHGSDKLFDYGDYIDVDKYALLQAHFDDVDIPAGVEAPFTWLPEYFTGSSVGVSNSKIKVADIDRSSGTKLPSPQLLSEASLSEKTPATNQRKWHDLNMPLGVESSKSRRTVPFSPYPSQQKPATSGASMNQGFINNSESMKLPPTIHMPFWSKFESAKNAGGSSNLHHLNFVGHNGSFHSVGIEQELSWKNKPYIPSYTSNSTVYNLFGFENPLPGHMLNNTSVHKSSEDENNDGPVVTISDQVRDEILRKFQSFKQFDTVEDASDHYFIGYNTSMKQHPKNWAKRIQEEWKILEKDLPDSIFVRVYESRMDLLRAVIIGAEGTPYHDGLFFFDVFFPSGYPNVPPKVHYHARGLRLNPNLYNCGKVCLSLLGTWSGSKKEKWLPGVSTILQVLVSIQGLILNAKPYFNEPGFAHMSGSPNGELTSLQYNEDTFILSLRTMMYSMKKPPKNFEDFVAGHFCLRAHDILVACKAYMEGAQVGCLVKGGVQDVDEGDKSCSKRFKDSLTEVVKMIVRDFAKVGAKDCEKFMVAT